MELSRIHNVFHISVLRKNIPDESHILQTPPVKLKEDLSYVEEPVEIIDHKLQELWRKTISLVKVLWRNHRKEEVTWELEENFRSQYPQLFDNVGK